MPMVDLFRKAHTNGHAVVTDTPISEEKLTALVWIGRAKALWDILLALGKIAAVALAIWGVFKVADSIDGLAGIIQAKEMK